MANIFFFSIFFISVKISCQMDVSKCGTEKGCILNPPACIIDGFKKPCSTAFSYKVDGEHLIMELYASTDHPESSFIAVGFSYDNTKGEDSVTDCATYRRQPLKGRLSYNAAVINYRVNASQAALDEQLQTLDAKKTRDSIYCKLKQKINPSAIFDAAHVHPLSTPQYILIAKGWTAKRGLEGHSFDYGPDHPAISYEKVNLLEYPRR